MAKSMLTPEGDRINYDNLIAVSGEVRSVGVNDLQGSCRRLQSPSKLDSIEVSDRNIGDFLKTAK